MKAKINGRGLALVVGLVSSGLAQAETTYTYTYSTTWTVGCVSGWQDQCSMPGTVTLEGATPSPAPSQPLPVAPTLNAKGYADSGAGKTIEQGKVTAWGAGIGVKNNGSVNGTDSDDGSSPEHSVDNEDLYDSVLYSFGSAVSLTDIALSWSSNDSDMTVLAYTGSNPMTLTGRTYADLINPSDADSAWTLVGHYYNVGSSVDISADTTNISSSYWLIGAANNIDGNLTADGLVATTCKTYYRSGGGCKVWNYAPMYKTDYVKIAALTDSFGRQYTPPSDPPGNTVPEPGSVLLLGLGSLLLARARMKKAA